MSNKQSSSSGVSAATLLGVLFVGLKLGHVIAWSWWWVTVPFWGGLVAALTFFLVCALIVGIIEIFESRSRRKEAERRRATGIPSRSRTIAERRGDR